MFLRTTLPRAAKLNLLFITAGFTVPFAISMRESMMTTSLKNNTQGLPIRGRSRPRMLC